MYLVYFPCCQMEKVLYINVVIFIVQHSIFGLILNIILMFPMVITYLNIFIHGFILLYLKINIGFQPRAIMVRMNILFPSFFLNMGYTFLSIQK